MRSEDNRIGKTVLNRVDDTDQLHKFMMKEQCCRVSSINQRDTQTKECLERADQICEIRTGLVDNNVEQGRVFLIVV